MYFQLADDIINSDDAMLCILGDKDKAVVIWTHTKTSQVTVQFAGDANTHLAWRLSLCSQVAFLDVKT